MFFWLVSKLVQTQLGCIGPIYHSHQSLKLERSWFQFWVNVNEHLSCQATTISVTAATPWCQLGHIIYFILCCFRLLLIVEWISIQSVNGLKSDWLCTTRRFLSVSSLKPLENKPHYRLQTFYSSGKVIFIELSLSTTGVGWWVFGMG